MSALSVITVIGLLTTISVQMWTLRLSIQANRRADEWSRIQTEHAYHAAKLNALSTLIQATVSAEANLRKQSEYDPHVEIAELHSKSRAWSQELEETYVKLEKSGSLPTTSG